MIVLCRQQSDAQLSASSSLLQPAPDMSGVSSWTPVTAPLPDIALHTIADPGHHHQSWTDIPETPDTVPTKQIILQSRHADIMYRVSNKKVALSIDTLIFYVYRSHASFDEKLNLNINNFT